MIPISAFIITKNEEARIARAIHSIKNLVSEIIVIDSDSTDNTKKIAEELGAIVVNNKWDGYLAQKAFGEKLCENEWILNIDADEELTIELQEEIKSIFANNNSYNNDTSKPHHISQNSSSHNEYVAYSINFVIMHRTDAKPRTFAPANRFIRIYNRNFCSFSRSKELGFLTTHDRVEFTEQEEGRGGKSKNILSMVYNLRNKALHRSATSISQLVQKADFYSSEQAIDIAKARRKISKIRIMLEIPHCFFKAYFLRRYFVFGFDGFVDSILFAFARFLRLAKARESDQKAQYHKKIP